MLEHVGVPHVVFQTLEGVGLKLSPNISQQVGWSNGSNILDVCERFVTFEPIGKTQAPTSLLSLGGRVSDRCAVKGSNPVGRTGILFSE